MRTTGAARLLDPLVDLVLPRVCAGCGAPGRMLCRRCAALLTHPVLAAPRRHPDGFPPTVAAGAYAGPVRPLVNAFKDRGRAELARPLGVALALAVATVVGAVDPAGPVQLVPLPSSPAALRERGRDHVGELAAVAVRELRRAGLPATVGRLLDRRGRVRDSAGMGAEQRRANLAGTFVLRGPPGPAGGLLVLVDDVVSSGATLTEAAGVLSAATARPARCADTPVLAAVVAATPRDRLRLPVAPGPGVFTVRDR